MAGTTVPASTAPATTLPEELRATSESQQWRDVINARVEQLYGKYLVPHGADTVRVGQSNVVLPHQPRDWIGEFRESYKFLEGIADTPYEGGEWDLLQPYEREMYEKFPATGLAKTLGKVGEFLDSGWLGRGIMKFFQWFPQTLEQGIGFGYQAAQDPSILSDAQQRDAAWEAAGKFYGFVLGRPWALPGLGEPPGAQPYEPPERLRYIETLPLGEFVSRLFGDPQFRADLAEFTRNPTLDRTLGELDAFLHGNAMENGGLPMLLDYRTRILNGMTPDDAYASLEQENSALALRWQWQNLMGQLVLDPWNYIAPRLRPVERIKGLANVARIGRVAPEVADALGRSMGFVDDLGRAIEQGQDASRALEGLRDIAAVIRNDELTAAVGKLDDAAKLGAKAEDVAEAARPVADLLGRMTELQDASFFERVAVWLTGGDPLQGGTTAWRRINPLALSPAARATMFVENARNVLATVIKWGDEPAEWFRTIKAAAAGAFGGKWGHMFLSPAGRHAQAVLRAWSAAGDGLLEFWTATAGLRGRAEGLAKLLGKDIVAFMNEIQKSDDAMRVVMGKLVDAARAAARTGFEGTQDIRPLAEALLDGTFRPADLAEIALKFKSTPAQIMPYTRDLMRAALMTSLSETAQQMGIAQFGVKQAGAFIRATNYLKASEALVLLGMNPLYPLRNFWNNEITMIARGVWGVFLPQRVAALPVVGNALRRICPTMEDVWDSFGKGFRPPRWAEGFGIEGADLSDVVLRGANPADIAASAGGDMALIRRAVTGPQGRTGARFMEMVRRVRGFRAVAGSFERMASQRAMTLGMMKAWGLLWKPPEMDAVVAGLRGRIRDFDPEAAKIIRDAVRNARSLDDIDAIWALDKLEMNPQTLLRRAFGQLGIEPGKVDDIVGPEITEAVRRVLADLGPSPSQGQVAEAFGAIRNMVNNHIDDGLEAALPNIIDELASKIHMEGPAGVVDAYSQISDLICARQAEHVARLEDALAGVRGIVDPAMADAAWRAVLNDSDIAWRRTWQLEGAFRKAIVEGMSRRGYAVADDFLNAFNDARDGWQVLYRQRSKLWNGFFKRVREGKLDDIARMEEAERIFATLDTSYTDMIRRSDEAAAVMDNSFLAVLPGPGGQRMVAAAEWRGLVRMMRRQDMESVLAFRQSIRRLPRDQQWAAWATFSRGRLGRQMNIAKMEQYGQLMMSGDYDSLAFFLTSAYSRGVPEAASFEAMWLRASAEGEDIARLLGRANWSRVETYLTNTGLTTPETQALTIALRDGKITPAQFEAQLADVLGPEIAAREAEIAALQAGAAVPAEQALRAQLTGQPAPAAGLAGVQLAPAPDYMREIHILTRTPIMPAGQAQMASLPAFHAAVPRQMYPALGFDELWLHQGGRILNELENQTNIAAAAPGTRLGSLPADLQGDIRRYLNEASGLLNETRAAALNTAEGLRDAALLNYRRQTNFDTWASTIFPFEFWYTHTIARWAISTLDHPTLLSTYMKMRQYLKEHTGMETVMPSRLRGTVRINLPFVPEELGDTFIDPLRSFGLPFEQFLQPFDQMARATTTLDGRIRSELQRMRDAGEITEGEYQQATREAQGDVWQTARGTVLEKDSSLEFDLMDFMNLAVSPHLPIQILWQAASGQLNENAVLPGTRSLRHMASLLGVEPGVYDNVWGNVRRELGLPAFDQWDDYRVDRTVTDMVGQGEATTEEGQVGMITRAGTLYDEAHRRSDLAGGISWLLGLGGLTVRFYAPGEEHQREIYEELKKAYDLDALGDTDAIRDFFDAYPEYESRLALWKTPAERQAQFLVDQIYDKYWNMPDLNRREIRDQLGDLFVETFIDPNTRNPTNVDAEILAMWSQMLGGEVPGGLHRTAASVELTDITIARRLDAYYDFRDAQFPHYYPLQDTYFQLDEGQARRDFLAQNLQLKYYWNWRRDFMLRNPDLAPYIEDDPEKRPTYPSAEALAAAQTAQPNLRPEEWQRTLGNELYRLLEDYRAGMDLPRPAMDRLDQIAEEMGVSPEFIIMGVTGQ